MTQWDDCVSRLPLWELEPEHIERYEDLGVSAFKDVDRPDYRRMLADARAGRVNVIVVHYMSRLSRKTAQETYDELSPLLRDGVRIISVGETREFHGNNLFAPFELLFKLQASHEESLNESLAVRATKDLEARLGGYTGKAPFGFTLVRETRTSNSGKPISVKILTPDAEHEAPIVRRSASSATLGSRGSTWRVSTACGRTAPDRTRSSSTGSFAKRTAPPYSATPPSFLLRSGTEFRNGSVTGTRAATLTGTASPPVCSQPCGSSTASAARS
ncbi:recombinase family protein [Streptomyces niveus]|uniref:recombinase family protein n=1 Tax=Streptomyces niveus TaxID=193462 RepID=UPI0033C5F3B8